MLMMLMMLMLASDASYLPLQGYQDIFRLDRSDGTWGGVGVYVANHLSVTNALIIQSPF